MAPCERSRSLISPAWSLVRGTSTFQPYRARDSHQDSLARAPTADPTGAPGAGATPGGRGPRGGGGAPRPPPEPGGGFGAARRPAAPRLGGQGSPGPRPPRGRADLRPIGQVLAHGGRVADRRSQLH